MRAHRRLVTAAAAGACALAVTAITSIAMNVSDGSDTGRTAQASEILSVTEVESPEGIDAAIGVEPPLQVRQPAPTTPPYTFRRTTTVPRSPLAASGVTEQVAPAAPTAAPTPTPTPAPPVATPAPSPSETPAPVDPDEDEGTPDTGTPGNEESSGTQPDDSLEVDWPDFLPSIPDSVLVPSFPDHTDF